MTTNCCVKGCGKKLYPACGLAFHRLPDDPELKKKWIEIIPAKEELTKNSTVCSQHFKDDDYSPIYSSDQTIRIRKLKQGVTPSIFTLKHSEPDEECEDNRTNNSTDAIAMAATARPGENKTKKIVIVPMGSDARKTNKVILFTSGSEANKKNTFLVANSSSGEKKIMVAIPNSEKNKTNSIIVTPISQIRQIGKTEIPSTGSNQLIDKLNVSTSLPQTQANKIMIIKPMVDEEKIEDIISTKSPSDTDIYDTSPVHKGSDDEKSSNANDKLQTITPEGEAFINEDTPKKDLKRKHVLSNPLDVDINSKVICSPSVNTDKTNTTESILTTSVKPNISEVSTQTGHYSSPKEEVLRKKIRAMHQDIRRRKMAYNQLNTVVRLIKNKCKTYDEVKEVLNLKLKLIPQNLDCDGIIIAP